MFAQSQSVPRPPWQPEAPTRPGKGWCGLWRLPGLCLHRLSHPDWQGPALRIALLTDPHVCWPWMRPALLRRIIAQLNGLGADLILLGGDFVPDRNMICRHTKAEQIAPMFMPLSAPLGVHGIMGNHDWKDQPAPEASGDTENTVIKAFALAGLPLLRNGSRRLVHEGYPFWLVGLDSQRGRGRDRPGYEDPEAAFAEVPQGAPVILLAHEPDYFGLGDTRALLQISGHTHGGQFQIFGRRPMTPSRYGDRYALGHFTEEGRHLVVSSGLGYSGLPFRFGVPPNLTLIELCAA